MTYAAGVLLDQGLVLASDSRTSAGVDRVSSFRKMTVFEVPDERVIVLLTSGNLSISQSMVSVLNGWLGSDLENRNLNKVRSMFAATRVVGAALREVHKADGAALRQHGVEFSQSAILAGQIGDEAPRLFHLYAAGNFIEATPDTPYFQIGEVKYGKPILDRMVTPGMDLVQAAKCVLMSFDSTMRSNVSVGPPIDLVIYRRDRRRVGLRLQLDEGDPYLSLLSQSWSSALRAVFDGLPNPDWTV